MDRKLIEQVLSIIDSRGWRFYRKVVAEKLVTAPGKLKEGVTFRLCPKDLTREAAPLIEIPDLLTRRSKIIRLGECFFRGTLVYLLQPNGRMETLALVSFVKALATLQLLAPLPVSKTPLAISTNISPILTFKQLGGGRLRCNQTNRIVKKGHTKEYKRSQQMVR